MQSISANLLAAAHALNRQPFASVIVDDPRIRGWRRTDSVSTSCYPFDARLTNNGKIVRAYNDSSANPGVLHIALATVGATPTFADVSIGTINLRQDSGVALYNDPTDSSSPNRIDCYYIDNTSGTPVIKNLTSTDNGTTWAAGSLSRNMIDPQIARNNPDHGSQPQLACAGWDGNGGTYSPYLFYTSASSNANDPTPPNLVFRDEPGGSNSRCWLDFIEMDVLRTTPPATCIGAMKLNSTDFCCVIAVNDLRGAKNTGIYLIWYRDGIWSDPAPIWTFQDVLPGNSTYDISYPRLQKIGSNYWVFATETYTIPGLTTPTTNKTTSHLVGFCSSDLIHWSAPIFIAGIDDIGDGYWTSVPASPTTAYNAAFSLNDFLMGEILVSSTRTFLVGYGRLFQLNGGTTSRLSSTASDYAAQTVDVTGDVAGFEISAPNGPAAQATVSFTNVAEVYNNSTVLERGSRVVIKAGYKTASNDSTDLATVFTGRIDEVRQQTALGQNEITLVCRDEASKLLEDWTADTYLEYSSGKHVALTSISDYGSTIQAQGTWLLQGDAGQLLAQATPVDINNAPLLKPNLALLIANTGRTADGMFDARFQIVNTKQGAVAGITFRYRNNRNFYFFVFNWNGSNAWDLLEFDHSTVPTSLIAAPVAPSGTIPGIDEVWWARVHVVMNKIVCSVRQEGATRWTTVLQSTTSQNDFASGKRVQTGTGYFGFAAQSLGLLSANVQNANADKGGQFGPEFVAQRFKVPKFKNQTTAKLLSYATKLQVKGAPGGTISFYVLQDDGTGTKPVPLGSQANYLTGANGSIATSSVKPKKGWTNVNINVNPGVNLYTETFYWLVVAPALVTNDSSNNLKWFYNSAAGEALGVTDAGSGGASWTAAVGRYTYSVTVAGAGGGVALSGYTLYSQDEPKSLDFMVREIATKAGILTARPNYVLNDDGSALTNFDTSGQRSGWASSGGQIVGYNSIGSSAYGYLRSAAQTFHEAVIDFDMTLGAASHSVAAGVLLNQQNTSTLTSDANLKCFEIEFNLDSGVVIIYALNGAAPGGSNRIFQARPLIDLQAGKQYHVKIQHSGKFIVVYLNGVTVAGVRTNSVAGVETRQLNPAGYFGLVSYSDNTRNSTTNYAAKFDNIVIQELKEVNDYFVVEAGQTGMQALEQLLKKERVKVYGDYDGALRYGYFDALTASGDASYTTTIVKATKTQSDRDWVSHLRPYGDYHADRFSGALLDSGGLRFRQYDYTDARSDRGAYHAGAYPIRNAREVTDMYEFTAAANPGLQREDRITIQNDRDGTNADYIVDSVTFRYVAGSPDEAPVFDMDVLCRKFIATSGEGAA